MLQNPTYLGDLVKLKTTTVSYKNHKNVKRDKEDWIVVPNTHEAIISRELWDKAREVEASVSQGKKTSSGFLAPLSGLMLIVNTPERRACLSALIVTKTVCRSREKQNQRQGEASLPAADYFTI